MRVCLIAASLLVAVAGCEGPAGTPGTNGADGDDGVNGKDGVDGKDGKSGEPGAGYLPLEAAGLVGFVRDVAGNAVVGATVYLVPAADIPTAAIDLSSIDVARKSTVDEPLEDTLAAKGTSYTQAVTDANGIYRIKTVPTGAFFVTASPAKSDPLHLPGGSLCRTAKQSAALVGKQLDIELSSKPSAKAEYVGASACTSCHGITHEQQTLHMLGIRVMGKSGPMQDSSRFPKWNDPLQKFTAGTTLYYFGYNGNAASPDWKVSETNPGAGVSFTAKLYTVGGKYMVDLTNVAAAGTPQTHEVELSYGGGLYKQRYVTKIGGSRYVLPIQFNFEGQTTETGTPSGRWVWAQYNAQNWYDEATKALKTPAKGKSFDNNCAGCHFTGARIKGDATSGFTAHGVADPNGEYDYDGDGKPELMNITCENCHGPGSEHWAKAGKGPIVSPRLLTPEREVAICSGCHTRANGIGAGATEAPLSTAGMMPVAGESRSGFLTDFVSKLDDGLWDATLGDGKHSKKHHQQASDFLKAKKYRNGEQLMTCSDCHDLHGNSGLGHQLKEKLDSTASGAGPGLCMSCHDAKFATGTTFASRQEAHWAKNGVPTGAMGEIGCADCHMPKTAKSGSGLKQATIGARTFWSGDISSHFFDMPSKKAIAGKAGDVMPVAYTSSCALTCHTAP